MLRAPTSEASSMYFGLGMLPRDGLLSDEVLAKADVEVEIDLEIALSASQPDPLGFLF